MLKLNLELHNKFVIYPYLNTSHVKVKLPSKKFLFPVFHYLNTSHVKVKHIG